MQHKRFWQGLRKKLPADATRLVPPALVILLMVGIGAYVFGVTRASVPTASSEAENGVVSGGASVVADPSASNSQAIQFGQSAAGHSFNVANSADLTAALAAAQTGDSILLAAGTYQPFTVDKSVNIIGASSQTVLVKGATAGQDVIHINASDVTLSGVTAYNCKLNPSPTDYENNVGAGIRVNDGANDVKIDQVIVRDSEGTNSLGQPAGCYGILVRNASAVAITNSDIYHNGAGIYAVGGGNHDLISNNAVHDNDVIIRDTPGGNDDYGAVAISFIKMAPTNGLTATGNNLYNNQGKSNDYVTDGGGFEIYNASNITMTGNTIANNDDVLETGTNSGGNCVNNTFSGNTASGKSSGSVLANSLGMVLRCAKNMRVTGNHFTNIDYWVFDIATDATFGGTVDGLTITGNTISQYQKVYDLEMSPGGQQWTIDNNNFHFTGPTFGNMADGSTVSSLALWRQQSTFDAYSTSY